jgi:hypothetical protein
MESEGYSGGGDSVGIQTLEEIARKKYQDNDHRTEKPRKTIVYSKM